jgi:hypothetical protein
MPRPRVADRGDSLQVWRVAANILNKRRGQLTGGGRGLTTPTLKLNVCYGTLHTASDQDELLLAWGGGGEDWIRLAQDRDRWRAVVSAVMNLRVLAPRS